MQRTSQRPYQRYAWVLLLVMALPALYGGLAHLVSGEPLAAGLQFLQTDPAYAPAAPWAEFTESRPATADAISGFVRMMAVTWLAYFLLLVTVIATGYRRGERWAWYVTWTYPAAILGFAAVATAHSGWTGDELSAMPAIAAVIGLVLLGLLLPLPIFFPRRGQGPPGRSATPHQPGEGALGR